MPPAGAVWTSDVGFTGAQPWLSPAPEEVRVRTPAQSAIPIVFSVFWRERGMLGTMLWNGFYAFMLTSAHGLPQSWRLFLTCRIPELCNQTMTKPALCNQTMPKSNFAPVWLMKPRLSVTLTPPAELGTVAPTTRHGQQHLNHRPPSLKRTWWHLAAKWCSITLYFVDNKCSITVSFTQSLKRHVAVVEINLRYISLLSAAPEGGAREERDAVRENILKHFSTLINNGMLKSN